MQRKASACSLLALVGVTAEERTTKLELFNKLQSESESDASCFSSLFVAFFHFLPFIENITHIFCHFMFCL